MSIVVINGGSRPNGNTRILTDHVVKDLQVETIELENYRIEPIVDERHAPEGFQEVDDDYRALMDRVMQHDILIFATPIYWYTMSGTMKKFFDRWSQTMREPEYEDFRERMAKKKAYVIAVGGDSPYIKGLPLLQQFHFLFDFVNLPYAGYVLGEANRPGAITEDKRAIFSADQLNETLKKEKTELKKIAANK